MLCQICEKAIQTAAKRIRLSREISNYISSIGPQHLSLRSFYQSVLAGCHICRWIWANLSLSPKRSNYLAPVFLDDPEQSIPPNFEEFRNKFVELVDSKSHRLGGYTVTKAISRAIIRAIQHVMWHYNNQHDKNIPYAAEVAAVQRWCKERSGMCIYIYGSGNTVKGLYDLAVGFEKKFLGKLELWPAHSIPKTVTAFDTRLKVRHSTADAVHLWCHWFATCLENHTDCMEAAERRLKPFRPKRLVQLLQDDKGDISTWKLDCRSAASAVNTIPYLTLSHCWGSSQPVRLTKDNFVDFLQPSPVSELPKTYQHALAIAQSLGFWYIWIDSLCIIQDDKEDWRTESASMGTIYSHAVCNIAASWAVGSTQGCFSASDLAARTPTFIPLKLAGLASPIQYQIGQAASYLEEIEQAPLNRRGWVVQERYLARRQLSFAKRQVYWECRQLLASEEFPNGVPLVLQRSKPHVEFEKGTDIRQIWVDLVAFYSNCRLTEQSDKLVALYGLASELQNITGDEYLSGLWAKDLYKQLCWQTHGYLREKVDRNTIPNHIVPTWSWATIDGPVRYDSAYCNHDNFEFVPWVQVLESSTDKLVLRSAALWGYIESAGPDQSTEHFAVQLIDRIGSQGSQSLGYMAVRIRWDIYLASSYKDDPAKLFIVQNERSSNFLFLVVRSRDQFGGTYEGLVLRKSCSPKDGSEEYVRLGIWKTLPGHFPTCLCPHGAIEEHLDDPRIADLVHTVTIV
ncbi:heterokaryon incompatibility protein-domain-containing protein [Hypoxylon sp. FL1857]|nr:heterokaryon incompatibility protein-domain-containing protein [Hypoxylon sp. FL1857]